jgi:hypothetical protein
LPCFAAQILAAIFTIYYMSKSKSKTTLEAKDILTLVGQINPYNRQRDNDTTLYNLYTAGFLAAYLASLMREDPYIYRRFYKHIESRNDRKN